MFRLRAMAGFTRNASVFALRLLLEDIRVASLAGLMPGVSDRQRCNL
jgi:hypothetical protein